MQPATSPTAAATDAGPQPPDEAIDVFGLTHPGKVRPENQDHFLLCSLHKTMRVRGTSLPNPELLEMPSQRIAFFGMVADGVGASEGGEEARRSRPSRPTPPTRCSAITRPIRATTKPFSRRSGRRRARRTSRC